MSDEGTSLSWSELVDELRLDDQPVSGPDETDGDWRQWYASFGTRGFVRSIAAPDTQTAALRIQFDVPAAGPQSDVAERVRSEVAEVVGVDVEVVETDEETELATATPFDLDPGIWGALLDRLEDLAAIADAESADGIAWLEGTSKSDEPAKPAAGSTDAGGASDSAEPTGRGAVFETIGEAGDESGASAALRDVRLGSVEIRDAEDTDIDVQLVLDGVLPSGELERLGRELAHSLRARYDVSARPVPRDDQPDDGDGGSRLGLRVEPADVDIARDPGDDLESHVASYFDRLQRFDELGVGLADVLGIGDADESSGRETAAGDADGRGRRSGDGRGGLGPSDPSRESSGSDRRSGAEEPPSETRGPTDGGRSEARRDETDRGKSDSAPEKSDRRRSRDADDASSGVVLDVGEETDSSDSSDDARGPLEAGNYTDPRLMREDATTRLVDVVLRHPGYAERKMGHNLSILLDVDYPDAMDLVESAPCVIAWSVGRERGEKFQRVIEDAGGKVVLIEPDSLP